MATNSHQSWSCMVKTDISLFRIFTIRIFFARKRHKKHHPQLASNPKIINALQKKNLRSRDEKKLFFFSIFFIKNCLPRACLKNYFGYCELRIAKMGHIFVFSKTCFSIFEIVIFCANS